MTDYTLSDAVLARRVFRQDVYDHLCKTTILRVLEPYINKDKVSIDVGAATGMISNFLAPRSNALFAYEAVPEVWDRTLDMANKHKNMVTLNRAIGNRNGLVKIYVDDKRLSNSGMQDLVDGPSTTVEGATLDSLTGPTEIGF
ncbi:MAG: hypothetical protein V3R41_06195, partial [Gammaproteobacteria bacterium]